MHDIPKLFHLWLSGIHAIGYRLFLPLVAAVAEQRSWLFSLPPPADDMHHHVRASE